LQNKKGFTLIEALVSLAIFSLILIGLLSAMLTAYKITLENKLRNEAVQIAREKINMFKTTLDTNMFKHENCLEADDNDKVIRRLRNSNYPFFVVGKIEDKGYIYQLQVIVCDKNKKEIYKTKTLVSK